MRFIRENRSMLAALQKKDWKAFARLYNGPAYAQNRYGAIWLHFAVRPKDNRRKVAFIQA